MHLYNEWLPAAVAEQTKREKESFAWALRSVMSVFDADDDDKDDGSSVFSTLKWISVLELFVKAKSEIEVEDVRELVLFGLRVFLASPNKLYAQVRWGNVLVRFLNKYRSRLTSLTIQWRPLYDTLLHTHFTRSTGPEGWRLRQRHFETVTSLVRSSRRFFPPGSALEIWSEFSSLLENPWHNSTFEGSGFVRLFLPTNLNNRDFYTNDWLIKIMNLWDSIPNCQFWNSQWAAIIARVIKNYNFIDWEYFLPMLFSKFLNMFEVPVANGSGSYPFSIDVPRNTRFLFSNKTSTPAKAFAKSIVYLLKPGGSAQEHFENLVNLLEQYYHPSNGGRWTYSLERFLLYLVITFEKRLQREQLGADISEQTQMFLGRPERASFVNVLLKIIDRGLYSKNEHLSDTVATATSILSYVEPSLVLPFVASRFHLALETMTATHQLKAAVMSLAYAGRPLLFTSVLTTAAQVDLKETEAMLSSLPMISLSNALLGMDANDPPKTLATMQLIGSIFSNIAMLDDDTNTLPFLPVFNFSEWLDEFFCRLFSLLQHLEPNSVLNEGLHSSATSGTFLVEDGPYYYCMLEILLGRLSKPLYIQALKRILKFVTTNILPGAIAEVGLLCCACIYTNPEEAVASLVEPVLASVIISLKGTPTTGFGGRRFPDASVSTKVKSTLSPALETALDYQLKMLSVAISYGGPALLRFRDQFKEAIVSAFESPSWKVNGAGDHLLRSLLGSLILYYPLDQYKCVLRHPAAEALEEWISTKDYKSGESSVLPKWHVSSNEEVQFANELLDHHLQSALDDLLRICQNKIHSDPGNEREHLKVTLLRIDSSLQGVLSCLPDFSPSSRNGIVEGPCFLIAGATGSSVGSTALREKAAEIIHTACKYLLEKKSDDSILLLLIVRIMDALGNYGSLEFDEWSNHRQVWKLQSAAIREPPINFFVSSHSKGKRRPRWALIDKAYMHNSWRSSQSSYHLYRTTGNFFPSEHAILLMDDLLNLSLHSYETVRGLAGKSLVRMIKRWPCMISKYVLSFSGILQSPSSPEYAVLGSCSVLSSRAVLNHLIMDPKAFSSFILGILSSSHHESLKAQKAINELFVKYNIHFSGVSKNIFRTSDNHVDGPDYGDLVSQIVTMSFDSTGLHWRYNLMANRVLLLLAMACRSEIHLSSKILGETAGHFLKNLKSQLPQMRMLAISALNTLLKESPYTLAAKNEPVVSANSLIEEALSNIFQEEGFFGETFNSLSLVHVIIDNDSASSRGNHGDSSFQSLADKSITRFYFDFSASWPRTPSWISLLGSDTFYSNFARIFKRLIQECGMPVLLALRSTLEEFVNAKERSKQCVAAEALAGVLHSDVDGLLGAWDSWIVVQLQNIILAQSVESIPEWSACIRYAVTGKGKYGTRIPLLRQQILDSLMTPLPPAVTTSIVAKRYTFLSAALIEISPQKMPVTELELHNKLLHEVLGNMCHSSAQVREAVGVLLSVLCSNIRLHISFGGSHSHEVEKGNNDKQMGGEDWFLFLTGRASQMVMNIQNTTHSDNMETPAQENSWNRSMNGDAQDDVKWMETSFHFIISTLKSGRSSYLLDIIAHFLYPIISLQETSNKDLSTLAKAAFELLKWRIFVKPHLQTVVAAINSSANDSNWRTRSATLTYLRTFMYRHTFILSNLEKQQIWRNIEILLSDNQVEVREHAAAALAGLMKGGDENLARAFRDRAYVEANTILKNKNQRNYRNCRKIVSIHGTVLALAASVLSVPYDMPSWLPEHVTLLARFGGEPLPIKSTVTKAVAEFRRTHADTWNVQKDLFTEEQLEVLADTSSSSSYFA